MTTPRASSPGGLPEVTADRPRPLTTAALDLLERCETELRAAAAAPEPDERYVHAHLSALRAGAALVAVHGRPTAPRRSQPRSVWEMLPRLDPDLEVWSRRFASTAPVRARVEAGRTGVVDAAAADALLADAVAFHRVVEARLGLSRLHPLAS
ncbi:SAV_6107 family HEPN domain-containing protein [Kineococcus sp. SYSU DK018]|uniref:SAV_6107 family HEPN domain-containing protein n=1 Tax=Kineococcus sp. SYSU DK018 TaxID=3383139 RepID=UPI003D7C4128